jgi:thiosulfate reductase cytochrome b subunit
VKRKRIDWDEELKKTERIRVKGFRYTAAGFALALFWLLGARYIQREISFAPMLLSVFLVIVGVLLFILVLRRKK